MTTPYPAASVGHAMTTDDPAADYSVQPRKGVLGFEQEASAGMDQGMRVLSYLLAGVLVYGGLGWLGDHLLHTHFLLPIGIVGGAALSVFMIIRRFGQVPETAPTTKPTTTTISNVTSMSTVADQDQRSTTTEGVQ